MPKDKAKRKLYFKCCLLFVENLFCLVNDLLNRHIILKRDIDGRLYIILRVVFENKFAIGFKYILKFLIGNIRRDNALSVSRLSVFDISMNIKFPSRRKKILTYLTYTRYNEGPAELGLGLLTSDDYNLKTKPK